MSHSTRRKRLRPLTVSLEAYCEQVADQLVREVKAVRRAGGLGAQFEAKSRPGDSYEDTQTACRALRLHLDTESLRLRREHGVDRVYVTSREKEVIRVTFRLLRSDADDLCHEVAEELVAYVRDALAAGHPYAVYEAPYHACVQRADVLNWLVPLAATERVLFYPDVIHDPDDTTYIAVTWRSTDQE